MTGKQHIRAWVAALLAALLLLGACRPAWQANVQQPDGRLLAVNAQTLKTLAPYAEEVGKRKLVPVERVLSTAGHRVIERLVVVEPGGARHELDWPAVAANAWWLNDGRLEIAGQTLAVSRIEAQPPALLAGVQAQIIDIAPTIATALGLPAPARAVGQPLPAPRAERAVLVLLDGLGYLRYGEARAAGLMPHLAALGEPRLGLTVYPSVTAVATPSLLTGAPPNVHGADRRGIRQTEAPTLFTVVTGAGRRVLAVEGESLPFNLPGAEIRLSGDRDGNGSTDDNVTANALAAIREGLPDLLYVHWHGIDDAGHSYGPDSPQETARLQEVDAGLGQVLSALPQGTLVVIVADHGMHPVQEGERQGNHGNLIERDMFIPIWVTVR